MDVTAAINMIAEEEACEDGGEHSKLYEGFEFYGDVSGKTLDGRRAIESRGVEMEFFKRMGGVRKGSALVCSAGRLRGDYDEVARRGQRDERVPRFPCATGRPRDQEICKARPICGHTARRITACNLLNLRVESRRPGPVQDPRN